MSTVGVEWSDRRADLATRHRVTFLDAPVSGSSRPAENGQLVVLASGPWSARSRLEPIFEPLARQIIWLDQVGDGSRLKLALNNWLSVSPVPEPIQGRIRRRPVLGGLINQYEAAA